MTINLPTLEDLLQWQLKHYAERLAAARTTKERAFLRGELYRLKNKLD